MDKVKRTALEAMINYFAEIERGEYSNDDNATKKELKYIYDLGGGDFRIGLKRFYELEKEKHEQMREDNPLFALYDDTRNSDTPAHSALIKFFEQDGHKMPTEQADKLAKEILDSENAKSAKRPLPVPIETVQVGAKDVQQPPNVNPEIEDRQKQVLELKQYGYDDKYIANKLSVTTKTVQRDKQALGILKSHKKGH